MPSKKNSMKQISSQSTYLYKKLFPKFFYGFILIFVVIAHIAMVKSGEVEVFFYLIPLSMAVISYVALNMLVFDLVDEVWDCGDSLEFKNKDVEERVPLSEIINLSLTAFSSPPRITVTLRNEGKLRKEIVFSPTVPVTLTPFRKPEIFDALLARVDNAKQD